MSGSPELAALIESGTVGEAGAGLESKALGGFDLGGIDISALLSGVGGQQGGQQDDLLEAPPIIRGSQVDTLAPLLSLLSFPEVDKRKSRRMSLL
jgi:hypothetical protein